MRNVVARPLTWWTVLRVAVEERLIYRADFALGTLMRFLPVVTQIFLWAAVFQGMGSAAHQSARRSPATRTTISSPITF